MERRDVATRKDRMMRTRRVARRHGARHGCVAAHEGGVMVALCARATPFGDEGRGHIHDTCDTHGLYASPPSDPFAAVCARAASVCGGA